MTYKEIVQKTIDLLKADANLSEPDKIKKYYFGVPIRLDLYPFIYVQWNERRATGKANISQFEYELILEIGVADRAVNEDIAEKSVYDKIEYIENTLNSNPSLDGLVSDVKLPKSIEIVRMSDKDYAVAFVRLLHAVRKWI
ncbi:MAG: hypothetical protein H3Z53_02340 [archaeon]|nr:hypothetical protein [archaeon]MCP8313198.1 hypothetical protein [archaeon]MCP8316068.1 hypothetical protein [archaeon]MCP8320226.1 hypothetical protein [archaeon]